MSATTPSSHRISWILGVIGAVARSRRPMLGSRLPFATVTLCAALGLIGLGASSAYAERPYDSSISEGFPGLSSLALDSNGNVWITDEGHETPAHNAGQNGLYEHNAYPSQTLLDTPSTASSVGSGIVELQVAVDQSNNNELFVADSNPRKVDIYEAEPGKPESYVYTHSWTGINSALSCFSCNSEIHAAVDNSNSYSRGRIYLSLTSPEDDIEAFDAEQRPVDFPAAATYINGNKLIGTPSGPFSQVGEVTVDSNGNIYVADVGQGVIDEFDSTGTFVRKFSASGTVAVDPTSGNVLIGNDEFDSSGNFIEHLPTGSPMAVNSSGYLYAGGQIYKPNTVVATVAYRSILDPSQRPERPTPS